MTTPSSLGRHFRVDDRFQRSVNITADYRRDHALAGYVVTPLVRSVLSRILIGLGQGAQNRAWSISGPYGTGKSAFAVYLCHVLGYPANAAARDQLRRTDPAVYGQLMRQMPALEAGGFLMVPIVGSRQPMAWSLLAGVLQALGDLPGPSPALHQHIEHLRRLHRLAHAESGIPPVDVAKALLDTARLVRREIPGVMGLFLIYDELGKSLEYAALNQAHADVGLLQILAEAAARSTDAPVALVTILHQAFEHYAALLGPMYRSEWAKVQGRFEDIPFQQSGGELLSLIQRAIQQRDPDAALLRTIRAEVDRAGALGITPRELSPANALEMLAGCAPLHPTVALVLGKLFRSRLAQNERSLFAFLSSGEPHRFQQYLRTETWRHNGCRPFYRLHDLYDYVQSALGSGLHVHAQRKRWAEIEPVSA